MTRFLAPPPEGPLLPRPAPTFSVVIPAYQAAATIAEAVGSALVQTIPPLEVIVCDDGSSDDLAGALEPYRHRVVLLRGPHQGAAAAKNRGIQAARGELVVFLDADDLFLPKRLQALTELARARPDLDLLVTDAHLERGGERVGRFYQHNVFATERQQEAILERNFILGHAAVRRSALLAVGGFDESLEIAEDWDCWIRLILAGARAGLVDEPLSVYRMREGSLTANRARALRSRVHALERVGKSLALTPEERAVLARSLAHHRRRALLAEAEQALRLRAPDARRRALAVALGGGLGLEGRLKAVAAALAPAAAGRYLDRRAGRGSPPPAERPSAGEV